MQLLDAVVDLGSVRVHIGVEHVLVKATRAEKEMQEERDSNCLETLLGTRPTKLIYRKAP